MSAVVKRLGMPARLFLIGEETAASGCGGASSDAHRAAERVRRELHEQRLLAKCKSVLEAEAFALEIGPQ